MLQMKSFSHLIDYNFLIGQPMNLIHSKILGFNQSIIISLVLVIMKAQSTPNRVLLAPEHISNCQKQEPIHGTKVAHQSSMTSLSKVKKRKVINKKSLRQMIRKRAIFSHFKRASKHPQSERSQDYKRSKEDQKLKHTKNESFVQFLQNHDEYVSCPICMNELIQPAATECGHLFCLECIEKALINGNRCPLCRQTIASQDNYGIVFDRKAQKLVQKLNHSNQSEESKSHHKSYFQWKGRRILKQQDITHSEFTLVDVWMLECNWTTGKIREIYRNQHNSVESLLIEIMRNNRPVKEIIEFGTLRLAKPHFYNKKKEKFELFRLGLRDMRQNVMNYEQFLIDRSRNLLNSQYFSIRSNLFIETLPIYGSQNYQRANEAIQSMPIISRVESELFSVENDSPIPMFQNLQPLPIAQNPQFETINLSRLNPSRNIGPNPVIEISDSEENLPL